MFDQISQMKQLGQADLILPCFLFHHFIWALTPETCFQGFASNKGADQPGHPCSLITTLVICLLESIISKFAPGEISFFSLVSVPESSAFGMA